MLNIEPVIGQVWVDNDPRIVGKRVLQIMDMNATYATMRDLKAGKNRRIAIKRLRLTRNGYRLATNEEFIEALRIQPISVALKVKEAEYSDD